MPDENSPTTTSRFGMYALILMLVPFLSIAIISFILEPFVSSLSNTTQRILMVLTLLLPAVLGAIFAITGLVKKERRKWIHIIALIINLVESLYFGLLLMIAG